MMVQLYAVKDTLTGFHPPVTCPNDQAMVRSFAQSVREVGTLPNRNAKDLQLFHVGSYDDQTFEFVSEVTYLCKGGDFVDVD